MVTCITVGGTEGFLKPLTKVEQAVAFTFTPHIFVMSCRKEVVRIFYLPFILFCCCKICEGLYLNISFVCRKPNVCFLLPFLLLGARFIWAIS